MSEPTPDLIRLTWDRVYHETDGANRSLDAITEDVAAELGTDSTTVVNAIFERERDRDQEADRGPA